MEIISIKLSQNEQYLAVLSGKNVIKQVEELHQLTLYKVNSMKNFELLKIIPLDETLSDISQSFYFFEKEQDKCLILTNMEGMIKFNFMTNQKSSLYKY